jgi:hypothetical protein
MTILLDSSAREGGGDQALQEFIARQQQKRVLEPVRQARMGPGLRLQGGARTGVSLFADTSV